MRIALAILLVCASAWGQAFTLSDPAWMGQQAAAETSGWTDTYYPTNITGYPAYTWYVAEGNFSSDTVSRWTNLTVNTGLDLTNTVGGSTPTYKASSINGRAALLFDGSNDTLRCTNYYSAMPHEVWMVVSSTNHSQESQYFLSSWSDGTAASLRYRFFASTPTNFNYNMNVSRISTRPRITNAWLVFCVFTDTNGNGAILTNNVAMNSPGTVGNNALIGLNVGSYQGVSLCANMLLAEMVTYRTNLTSGVRSNLYNYLTNKYAITP